MQVESGRLDPEDFWPAQFEFRRDHLFASRADGCRDARKHGLACAKDMTRRHQQRARVSFEECRQRIRVHQPHSIRGYDACVEGRVVQKQERGPRRRGGECLFDPPQRRGIEFAMDETMNDNPLLSLFGYFALLSLFAVGGANAAIPEMHRIAVEVMQWMTERQFADSFAIAQISPGPNIIIVTLIGYHVAGLAGAAVATAAMCGPTCILAFLVARTWDRFKEARWRIAIQSGLVPVSLGLIAASAFVLARSADHNIYAAIITGTTALVGFATRINPLWIFAVGGLMRARCNRPWRPL